MITFEKGIKRDGGTPLKDFPHRLGDTFINSLETRVYMMVQDGLVVIFELAVNEPPYSTFTSTRWESVRPVNLKIRIENQA